MTNRMNIREFVDDLRAGLSDRELMNKYDLDLAELEKVFQTLIDADFITILELHERARITESAFFRAFAEVEKAMDDEKE